MSKFITNCVTGKTTFITASTDAVLADDVVTITLPDTTVDIKNKDVIQFKLLQCLTALGATTERIKFSVNGTDVDAIDKYNNYLRVDQLRRYNIYYTTVSTDPNNIAVLTNVPCSAHVVTNVIAK